MKGDTVKIHKHKILTEQAWVINELFGFLCRTVNSNRPLSTQEGNNITVKAKPFKRDGPLGVRLPS